MEIGDLDIGDQAFVSINGKDVLVAVEEQQPAVSVVYERCIPGMYYGKNEDGDYVALPTCHPGLDPGSRTEFALGHATQNGSRIKSGMTRLVAMDMPHASSSFDLIGGPIE